MNGLIQIADAGKASKSINNELYFVNKQKHGVFFHTSKLAGVTEILKKNVIISERVASKATKHGAENNIHWLFAVKISITAGLLL